MNEIKNMNNEEEVTMTSLVPIINEKKIYIVKVKINDLDSYYLADLDFTISKNEKDALIFLNKNNAYKLASIIENKYEGALGVVVNKSIQSVIF